jgi:hypothetical protein
VSRLDIRENHLHIAVIRDVFVAISKLVITLGTDCIPLRVNFDPVKIINFGCEEEEIVLFGGEIMAISTEVPGKFFDDSIRVRQLILFTC